jgi:hypothetical protein
VLYHTANSIKKGILFGVVLYHTANSIKKGILYGVVLYHTANSIKKAYYTVWPCTIGGYTPNTDTAN